MNSAENSSQKSVAIGVAVVLLVVIVAFAVRYMPSVSEERETTVAESDSASSTVATEQGTSTVPTADTAAPVTDVATSPSVTADTNINTNTPATTSSYKDGVYTAVGDYRSPAGAETIDVSVTLKDDVIIDATVTGNATNGKSIQYQNLFIGGYKALVIGKKISDVKLDKVSGSSLTPAGFNEALTEIQAKAAV